MKSRSQMSMAARPATLVAALPSCVSLGRRSPSPPGLRNCLRRIRASSASGAPRAIPTKTTSITANGPFFSLTNEQGSNSSGHLQGMNQNVIVADQWQFVQGTLSPDGTRINWSNGTFWAQCNQSGGGGHNHGRLPNLQGTWYRDGNHSLACSIQQNKKNLSFTNESGQTAQGSFLGPKHVTANWGGQTINGTLVNNAGRINWDNGTSWSR